MSIPTNNTPGYPNAVPFPEAFSDGIATLAFERRVVYDKGFTDGATAVALAHGIADERLWLHSAEYHAVVSMFFTLLAFAHPALKEITL